MPCYDQQIDLSGPTRIKSLHREFTFWLRSDFTWITNKTVDKWQGQMIVFNAYASRRAFAALKALQRLWRAFGIFANF
jgi:hypothetical protein